MKKSTFIISGAAIVLVALAFFSLRPGSPTGFNIMQLNPFANCTDANVSYQVNESYDADLRYQIVENTRDALVKEGNDEWAVAVLKVKNVDSVPGVFTVVRFFETAEDGKVSANYSKDIAPGETVDFRSEYDINNGEQFSASYLIYPEKRKSIKMVTHYRIEKQCDW